MGDNKAVVAVPLPAALVLFLADRQLFAVALGRQARLRYAQAGKVIPSCLSPLGAQRQVVFIGPPFVSVTLDLRPGRGVGLEPTGVGLKRGPRIGLKVIAVEIKVDVFERSSGGGLTPTRRLQTRRGRLCLRGRRSLPFRGRPPCRRRSIRLRGCRRRTTG